MDEGLESMIELRQIAEAKIVAIQVIADQLKTEIELLEQTVDQYNGLRNSMVAKRAKDCNLTGIQIDHLAKDYGWPTGLTVGTTKTSLRRNQCSVIDLPSSVDDLILPQDWDSADFDPVDAI